MKYKSSKLSITSVELDPQLHIEHITSRNLEQAICNHQMELIENFHHNTLYNDFFLMMEEIDKTEDASYYALIKKWGGLLDKKNTTFYTEPYLHSSLFLSLAKKACNANRREQAWSLLCHSQELYFDASLGIARYFEELKQSHIAREKAEQGHAHLIPIQKKVAELLISKRPPTGWNTKAEATRAIMFETQKELEHSSTPEGHKRTTLDLAVVIPKWTTKNPLVKEAWERSCAPKKTKSSQRKPL